ncbi:MAG TPA: M28 family peptidase [Anaerolineales bacterium]|nr:M28 family peptidase [Anaerolineales bacterium]
MIGKKPHWLLGLVFGVFLNACTAMPQEEITVQPEDIRFSGERAFDIETEFVRLFPNRHSGQPNNRLAAEWLHAQLTNAGWDCQFDEWEIFNYSRTVPLTNVACKLQGASAQEFLIVAHHDQASTTIEGADNDASGVSILVHLAEVFASEPQQPYTLAFVFTDAEDYGMIGTARYIDTHPNPDLIIAGVSLDNLGRTYYNGLNMELIGRYRKFGPIWLGVLARDSAVAAGIEWKVYPPILIDQITGQAAPISFMDQGPMVAAGIPALGFAGRVPAEVGDEHYRLWHNPDDTMENQSAASLNQSGRITEALIRQLQSMESFPQDSGPYLYLEDSEQIIRGIPLWVAFIGFTALFFLASLRAGGRSPSENISEWGKSVPHFLGLWLPLVATVLFLYLLVQIGVVLFNLRQCIMTRVGTHTFHGFAPPPVPVPDQFGIARKRLGRGKILRLVLLRP